MREFLKEYCNPRRVITEENISFYTYLSVDSWIAMTGLSSPPLEKNFVTASDVVITGDYPSFQLIADSEHVFLQLTVNLETKTVYVQWFILAETGNGTGRKVLNHFIQAFAAAGFTKIKCTAKSGRARQTLDCKIRKSQPQISLCGSLVWAKMGFTMTNREHILFLHKMKEHNRKETCLHELMQSEDGLEFWKKHFPQWKAQFSLGKNSYNTGLAEKIRTFSLSKVQ